MSKKYNINTHDFDPLLITGLQLYLNRYNATPSSWLDVSSNAYNFAQATATQQPDVLNNMVRFDGVNDWQGFNVSNIWSSHSSGILFFSGSMPTTGSSLYLSSADMATNNSHIFFQLHSSGKLRIQVKNLPTFDTIISTTSTVISGSYFYGYIESDGSNYFMNLNGVDETIIIVRGADDGKWFSSVPDRDNFTIASLNRISTAVTNTKANKMIYSTAALSSGEKADILNFMSDQNN